MVWPCFLLVASSCWWPHGILCFLFFQLEWEQLWWVILASHALKAHLWKWNNCCFPVIFDCTLLLESSSAVTLVLDTLHVLLCHNPFITQSYCHFLPRSYWSLSKMYSNFLTSVTLHICNNTISDTASAFSLTFKQSSIVCCHTEWWPSAVHN